MTFENIKKANKKLTTLDVKGKAYVQVNERVKAFREACPDGFIKTDIISFDGERVTIQATIGEYIDGHERILATGLAQEKESSSYINKTSYIENCETSAVGRALGFAGFGIDASMCSAEEVANAITQQRVLKAQEPPKDDFFGGVDEATRNEIREMLAPCSDQCRACADKKTLPEIKKALFDYSTEARDILDDDQKAAINKAVKHNIALTK